MATERLKRQAMVELKEMSLRGFTVLPAVLCPRDVEVARGLAGGLIRRHRERDQLVLDRSVRLGEVIQQNPGVDPGCCADEPFIIGDLPELEPAFGRVLALPALWRGAALLLGCQVCEVVFHMANLTRKPPLVGPAIGWHRDATNTYIAAADGRTIRLLLPLQPMSECNGGTAVLPGSHLVTVTTAEADLAAAVCPQVLPGDALVLHSQVLHGGMPNRSECERDVIVIQFGVRSSPLSHHASELLSMTGIDEFRRFARLE